MKVTYDVLGTPTLADVNSSSSDPGVLTIDCDGCTTDALDTATVPAILNVSSSLNPSAGSFVPGTP